MAYKNERVNNIEIICPMNEIDAITGNEIKNHISKLTDVIGIIINFNKVNYLNSSGLRELIQSLRILKDKNIPMALCNLSDNITKIFTNTNLHKLFDIFNSENDAIKHLQEKHSV
ncbi:STAS domain-containing protein [Deferribacter autotrophicus]|uniref:Anti-sigma factor antagonist n=1 Tax=Deferribacter autotrophicus TaxID=500465 RepID=A0A5A8F754_9BACT|nr:STAS domain-containing protein [Deferribacter autotrophicus]KAA0259154.1 STAS domain-containing protein [Deferribacter autotrophicus]